MGRYGVLLSGVESGGTLIGAFQVKRHYRQAADLEIIRYSAEHLAIRAGDFPRIALNMPGTGYGRRSESEVVPILDAVLGVLPNVFIYKFPSG